MSLCPTCRQLLPEGTPPEKCPRCLLALGLVDEATAQSDLTASSSDSTDTPVTKGTRVRYVGDYELLEEIARGGMGVVFKARQSKLNRIVAVKMILTGSLASAAEIKRFQIEAEAVARLRHPGIVPIHEIGEHEGVHYFSMDFIEGGNLAQVVAARGPLPALEAASMLKSTAEAIEYAHQQGTLHRDLKPHNIVIDSQGRPHVTDFGLAKRLWMDQEITRTGALLGTPAYMSPEQATGRWNDVGPLSDVYALGAVLYFSLTGKPPFSAPDPVSLLRCVIETLPEAPRKINPLIPFDLENICLRALEKDPLRRYNSAAELAKDLDCFIKGETVHARRPGRVRRTYGWFQRHAWVTQSLFGILFLAISFLAYAMWEKTQFLLWTRDHPLYKPNLPEAEKRLNTMFDFMTVVMSCGPTFFLAFMKRNYLRLVREGKYAGVLYLNAIIGIAIAGFGVWTFGCVIRAHIWVQMGLNESILFYASYMSFLAIFWGPFSWFMTRKELRLLRLGQTPFEGFTPEEYQTLVELHWNRNKARTRELARSALLKGDRSKAETIARCGNLGGKFEDFEKELGNSCLPNAQEAHLKPGNLPDNKSQRRKRGLIFCSVLVFVIWMIALIPSFIKHFSKASKPSTGSLPVTPTERELLSQQAVQLQKRGKDAQPELMRMLRSGNAEEQSLAAQLLGQLGPAVVPLLKTEIHSPQSSIRCWAAVSLGILRASEMVPNLVSLADDQDHNVRTAVAFALLRMKTQTDVMESAVAGILEKRGSLQIPGALPFLHLFEDYDFPFFKICQMQTIWGGLVEPVQPLKDIPDYTFPASHFLEKVVEGRVRHLFNGGDTNSIPLLLRLLPSPNRNLWVPAANALALTGSPAVPPLIAILAEGDEAGREHAAYALGQMNGSQEEAVPALLQMLQKHDIPDSAHCSPCAAAVFALSAIKKNSVQNQLSELLQSDNRTASRYAASALGKMTNESLAVSSLLTNFLKDSRWHVRAGAALALGELGPFARGAAPTLHECLSDTDPRVGLLVTTALARIAPELESESLRFENFLKHEDSSIRLGAVIAISKLKAVSPVTIAALRAGLTDQSVEMRIKVLSALAKLGGDDPETIPALRKSLRDPVRQVRNHAALALARIYPNAMPALIADTEDEDPEVRQWAVYGLGSAQPDPGGLEAITSSFKDEAIEVRKTAAWAAGRMASSWRSQGAQGRKAFPPPVIQGLITLMDDENSGVRAAAVDAMGLLKAPSKEVLTVLSAALKDSDFKVQRQAAFALGKHQIPSPEMILILESTLADPKASVFEKNQATSLMHKTAFR